MKFFRDTKHLKMGLLGLITLLVLGNCSSSKIEINRDFAIPDNTSLGFIYGKLNYPQAFGDQFKITFKNRTTNKIVELSFAPLGVYTGSTDYLLDLPPGEYLLHQVLPQTGAPIDIPQLQKDEHREFFVEAGKLTYVGTWGFSESALEVKDEKLIQDEYMKSNYKYVSTSTAMQTLP